MRDLWGSRGRIPYAEYARRFHRIRDKNGRIIPFIHNEQQNIVRQQKNAAVRSGKLARFILVKHRQWGGSTQELSLGDYLTGTYTGMYAMTIAHDLDTTIMLFGIVNRYYEYNCTPDLVEMGTGKPLFHWARKTSNKRELVYPEADSGYFVGTAGNSNIGTGMTLNRAHLSEAAKFPALNDSLAALEGVPLSGEIILESTPHGAQGPYYEMAQEAFRSPKYPYTLIFFRWFESVEYALPVTPDESAQILREVTAGADSRYGAEEQSLAENLAIEGRVLSAGQWKWRRLKRDLLGTKFYEQYPQDFVSCWLASGRPFFDSFKLAAISDGVVLEKHEGGSLWIYEQPIKGRDYILWADPAEGIQRGREDDGGDAVQSANRGATDFSAWGIIDREVNQDVAVSLSRITPMELARQIDKWGRIYNDALAAPERNNHGHAIILGLIEVFHYPNLYKHLDGLNDDGTEDRRPGWPTGANNRTTMLDNLDDEIRSGAYVPIDPRMREQMKTFVVNAKGRAEAGPGYHDDLVTGRAIGNEVVRQPRNFSISMIG